MNRSFEAALAARWHWVDAQCLEAIGGFDEAVEVAKEAAYMAVADVAWSMDYGVTIPPLLLGVPQLESHYKREYESASEVMRELSQEYEFQREREQYLNDIADTYAEIERDLIAGWREDCRDDGYL